MTLILSNLHHDLDPFKHALKKYSINVFRLLDLDPTPLVFKVDLDILKVHLHTENEVSSCSGSKVTAQTGAKGARQIIR